MLKLLVTELKYSFKAFNSEPSLLFQSHWHNIIIPIAVWPPKQKSYAPINVMPHYPPYGQDTGYIWGIDEEFVPHTGDFDIMLCACA